MRLLKILVLSAFIANAGSAELSLELTRKMSASQTADVDQILENLFEAGYTNVVSSEQSAAVEAKKSTIQIQHEETEKIYEPLINVLKGDIAQHILESIDFKAFQEEILSIILTVLKKKERLGLDDKSIVDQALSLWITVIIYNSDLLQYIYSDQEVSRKEGKTSVIETLLEQGMFCANFAIRSCFRDSFKILFQCVKTQTLETPPYIFFLAVMLQNLNMTDFKSNEAKQFFETLRILLHQYFEAEKAQNLSFQKILNEREILQEFIIRLQTYESREKKGQLKEDANLLGLIQIIYDLIKNNASILNPDEYRGLLLYIVESCLFTKNVEPLNIDITKETDIIAYEKPYLNKCQVTDSRGAAYSLLQLICVNNPQLIFEIIKEHLNPLVYKVNKPKKQGFAPRHETRSWHGYCGFVNLASICYMIAMIQQLYHVPAFRYLLLAAKPTDPLNPQEFEGDTVEDNMLHQLIKLMGFMELSERQAYNPREFCFSFKTFDGQPTNVRIQQDSYEFLNIAYERIENMLAKTSQKYLLQSVFGGQLTRMMICQSCGNLRQSTEEFYAMSLEVKNMKSIYDGLRKVISGEIINDYKCESCNQKVDIVRKTAIESLPNMLIVHLQRLYFDMDTFQNQKLNSRVEFPNVLNVKPFMINEVLKQEKDLMKKSKKDKRRKEREESKVQAASMPSEEGKEDGDDQMEVNPTSPEKPLNQQAEESSSDDEQDINMQALDEEEDYQYKLVGVVVHMGVADAGHYISYVNIARSQKNEADPEWLLTDKEKWLEFNDSTVKDYRFTNLDEDCFGGGIASNTDMKDHTKNAYLLMYEKRRKRDIKVVLTEESMVYQQNLAAQTLVDLTPPEELKNVMSVCPSLQEKLRDSSQILYDEEKKEHYALVGFKDAQKFVPNDIYVKVHEDNYRFMCERQVFSNTFFESTKSILQQLCDKQPDLLDPSSEDSAVIFSFVKRVLFDLLQMTTENKQLLDMTKLLLNMMIRNHQQLLDLINDRVLVDKKALGKDERTFLENLLANQEKEIREMHELIAVFSVNKCLEKGDIGIVDSIMDQTWAMLPDEASKCWIKMHQFLDFIFEVTRSGNAQLCYMIEHQAVSKLIDFYLESESPKAMGKKRQQMGSSYANPPFEPLILAVSYIVRSYPYIDMGAGEFTHDAKSFQMINFFPGEIPPLTQSDIDFLRLKQFYAKNLKSGFERQEFGRLITHLSFGNYHFSRMICKRVLIGINKASQDEIEPYLHAIVLLLLLNDHLKQQRYEWLLGVPQLKIDKTTIYHSLNQTSQSSKLGVALIDAANDDVYEYKSTLFKQTSNIKESYLQIVYQYRKKWVKFSMNCLNALLQSCQQDLTGKLALYLKTLDPPNYTYARYIDWIKPYLVDQIEFMMKNQNIQSVQQDLVLAIQLNQIYDQIFGESIGAKNDQALDKKLPRQVISHDSSDGGPEQYLMWNIVEEKIINELNIFDDQITLYVKQLTVRIGESKPDGLTNQSFPAGHFSYNNRQNQNNNAGYNQQVETGNMQGGRRIPAYGRGQNQHYNVVDQRPGHTVMQPSQSRKAPSRTNKKKRYTVQVRPEAQGNNQDADVQFDSNQQQQDFNGDDNYGVSLEQEYNGQDSHQQLEEQQQDNSMEVEFNNDHSDQSGDNSNREECFDPASEFKQQQDSEAQYEQIDTSIHPQDSQYQAHQDPEMEDIPQEQEQVIINKMEDEVWEATCEVVLVFSVRNFNEHKAQTVQLTFFDNSEPGTLPLNTRLPKSTVPLLLMGGNIRDIIVLTKNRPFEDWGDYNYKLDIVRAPQASDIGQAAVTNEDNAGYANQGFQTGNDVGVEGYNDLMEAQMANQKECGACTFFNDSYLTICEMCGTPLK